MPGLRGTRHGPGAGTASDPEDGELTYSWDFGDGSADAATQDATHTYTDPGTYTATLTVTDEGGLTASDTVTIEATDCPATCPDPDDEFDGTELDTCRWTEIVCDSPAGRAVADGALAIDTGNGTDMYGGTTNAANIVLQPAPDGRWEATTKVDIALAEKTYEQAALMVYGHVLPAGGPDRARQRRRLRQVRRDRRRRPGAVRAAQRDRRRGGAAGDERVAAVRGGRPTTCG